MTLFIGPLLFTTTTTSTITRSHSYCSRFIHTLSPLLHVIIIATNYRTRFWTNCFQLSTTVEYISHSFPTKPFICHGRYTFWRWTLQISKIHCIHLSYIVSTKYPVIHVFPDKKSLDHVLSTTALAFPKQLISDEMGIYLPKIPTCCCSFSLSLLNEEFQLRAIFCTSIANLLLVYTYKCVFKETETTLLVIGFSQRHTVIVCSINQSSLPGGSN